jgi:hypothetical protein
VEFWDVVLAEYCLQNMSRVEVSAHTIKDIALATLRRYSFIELDFEYAV